MFSVSFAYEPTPEEKEFARRARRALIERMGLIIKEVAAVFGKPEKYIDDQLSARRSPGHRWWGLDGFALAFAEIVAEEHGAFLIERRRVLLIEVETKPKRMAKAALVARKREGVA